MATVFDRIAAMPAEKRNALAQQFDKASRVAGAEPIAVVGIGCRFPGGSVGPESYWKFLIDGGDGIGEVPADRWDADEYYDADQFAPGRMNSKWGGFLPEVGGFDAEFFGITPREAQAMDPQQRVLLEVAYEALSNAGIDTETLDGSRCAVLAGVYYNEYQGSSAADPDRIDAYSATGNAHSVTVGRIAYLLGLRGPAVAVDTACSSSLVAVHLACQGLRTRESDLALAGGVNLILRPETQLALAKWGMLSPRGRCHSFDAGADGFVRGEGAGVVVLKRLTDAVRDGDRVLAVVRGSAVNSDGRSNGLTAPNAPAQRDVITAALRNADVSARSVNLIETHGTGTALGDPIEFDALAAVYGSGTGPCALGAVKSNFGHLEAAAGIAGFIKVVLALQHAKIPPNLHFTAWNPAIDAAGTRLFVPTSGTDWPDCDAPRRAGVSSFGLGGTNAHVVLEQGPDPIAAPTLDGTEVTVLMVTGRTEERIAATAGTLADWLTSRVAAGDAPVLPDIAATLAHRSHAGLAAAVCARDHAEAITGLGALATGTPAPGVVPAAEPNQAPGVVFVYSGQGSQWAGMGRQLLAEEPTFAAAVAELEPDFRAATGFSLRDTLAGGEPVIGIDRIQPVLTGMQLALTALWRSRGVEPDAVIGHSMGEVAAAVVAGALSTADGLAVIATRSTLMARLSGRGAMALVELDATDAEALISGESDISVAVYASPKQTVLAGPPERIDALIAQVQAGNRLARRVEVDVASHHLTVDPILPELRAALAGLTPRPAKIPLLSTTGVTEGAEPVFDADYWVKNLRNPVRFVQTVTAAGADHGTFIEVSPHPVLTHAITETLGEVRGADRPTRVLPTLLRNIPEVSTFHAHLVAAAGAAAVSGPGGRLIDIPPAPWRHSVYWMAGPASDRRPIGAHPLLGVHLELPTGEHVWQGDVGTAGLAWLADHRVHGQPVLPAAGFVEMVLAAGSEALGVPGTALAVARLEVEQMLPLGEHTAVSTRLTRTGEEIRVEIHSRSAQRQWTRHAVAGLSLTDSFAPPDTGRRPGAGIGAGSVVAPSDFYAALRRTGAHHGPAFTALTRIARKPGGISETEIALPDEATGHRGYRIHPVLLDAALQSVAAAVSDGPSTETAEITYLPVSVESLRVLGDVRRRARCYAEVTDLDDDAAGVGAGKLGRVVLTDEFGTWIAEISGIYLRRVERRTVPLPLAQKLFQAIWEPSDMAAAESDRNPGSWLVLTDGPDSAEYAAGFTARFAAPERRVLTAQLSDESGMAGQFAAAAAAPELPPAGVLVFIGADGFDGTDTAAARAGELVWSISAAVRTVINGWQGSAPRLWLITRGGLTVEPDEAGDPAVGALRGLVRVLAYEHPDLRFSLVDVGFNDTDHRALIAELTRTGDGDVIAWRGNHRWVQRLARADVPPRRLDPVVRAGGAYLVSGGLGGLGLLIANWLAEAGAGRIVLNGRSEPGDAQRAAVAELGKRTEVAVITGDIAAAGVAERLVAGAEETGLALRGVIHAAAVLDDRIVLNLDRDSLDRVWRPKVAGALRLHTATAGRPLDFFAGFSSMASLLGSPGQGAYACANAWLDALTGWRRAAGLPATAINWGQWSDVGLARALTIGVLDPISPAEGIEALDALLAGQDGQIGVARLRLDRAAAAFPEIGAISYFAKLFAEQSDAADAVKDWIGSDGLRELPDDEIAPAATARLRMRIAAIMGYPDYSAVALDTPLTGLGMDSLMAVRIRNAVRADFGVEPSVALLLQGASLADLAGDLIRQLGLASPDEGGSTEGVRDRAQQRAAARQRAVARRKVGH